MAEPMSLITCCPACGTMFKVVPDQLKISDGWVRCGHCAEVFDATAHFCEPTPETLQEPVVIPASEAASASTAGPVGGPSVFAHQALSGRAADEPATQPAAPWPPEGQATGPTDPILGTEARPTSTAATAPAVMSELAWSPADDSTVPAKPLPDAAPHPSAHPEPSFLRQARRRALWRGGVVRGLLLAFALVLALLLASQWMVAERDRLAVAEPALKPLLERLCQPLGCVVRPPRQIDAIVIDSSAFAKVAPEAYKLQLTVRNTASAPLALPAMELTLTDSQDQPVVRRVLRPAELGATGPLIAAGAEWNGSAVIAVAASAGGSRISGYRLLAFYP